MKSVHLYGVSTTKTTKTLGHRSANLVGIVVVRHDYGFSAQRGVAQGRKSMLFEFSSEVSFKVLSCFAQMEGSMLLTYRKEIKMDCTVNRGLRVAMNVAICEGLLRSRLVFGLISGRAFHLLSAEIVEWVSVRDFRIIVLMGGYLELKPSTADFR